jgi:hypothetical protein
MNGWLLTKMDSVFVQSSVDTKTVRKNVADSSPRPSVASHALIKGIYLTMAIMRFLWQVIERASPFVSHGHSFKIRDADDRVRKPAIVFDVVYRDDFLELGVIHRSTVTSHKARLPP